MADLVEGKFYVDVLSVGNNILVENEVYQLLEVRDDGYAVLEWVTGLHKGHKCTTPLPLFTHDRELSPEEVADAILSL